MITPSESASIINNIENWKMSAYFSVGGFEWLGFSKNQPNKMIIISSQKNTLVNCDNGKTEECLIDCDEEEFVAICEQLPSKEISIIGQYNGKLPNISANGEKLEIKTDEKFITTIVFTSADKKEYHIFYNYGFYICGFSYDGNHFVLLMTQALWSQKENINHNLRVAVCMEEL